MKYFLFISISLFYGNPVYSISNDSNSSNTKVYILELVSFANTCTLENILTSDNINIQTQTWRIQLYTHDIKYLLAGDTKKEMKINTKSREPASIENTGSTPDPEFHFMLKPQKTESGGQCGTPPCEITIK